MTSIFTRSHATWSGQKLPWAWFHNPSATTLVHCNVPMASSEEPMAVIHQIKVHPTNHANSVCFGRWYYENAFRFTCPSWGESKSTVDSPHKGPVIRHSVVFLIVSPKLLKIKLSVIWDAFMFMRYWNISMYLFVCFYRVVAMVSQIKLSCRIGYELYTKNNTHTQIYIYI